jgi:hypothetical protein
LDATLAAGNHRVQRLSIPAPEMVEPAKNPLQALVMQATVGT